MTPRSLPLTILRTAYNVATDVAGVVSWLRSISRILDAEHAFQIEESRDWWSRGGDTRLEKSS